MKWELKMCPWCKGRPYVDHDNGWWRIVCLAEACPVNPSTVQCEDREAIIERWNRRGKKKS